MSAPYSVLLSVYIKENPENFVKSIDSILNQSLPADEIVLVKDGPLTAELEEAIDKYVREYADLFTIVPLERNHGLGLALNEGLKVARNELVARMDTDDIALPNRCELQVEAFNKDNDLIILGGQVDEFVDNPSQVVSSRNVPQTHEEILRFARRRSPFNHPTVMYKRSAVLNCEGGYHNILRKEDLDLFGRMLIAGHKAANLQDVVLLYRANAGSLSRRRNWVDCSNYIKVIYGFWRQGFSKTPDLLYVVIGQIALFLLPGKWIQRLTSRFLRTKRTGR